MTPSTPRQPSRPSLRLLLLLGLLVAVAAPGLPAQSPVGLPEHWMGPGPLHTVLVDALDPDDRETVVERIRQQGGVRLEVDYGRRVLLEVDEAAWGGREGFLAAGLPVRDEHRLIPVNGRLVDGDRAEKAINALSPEERFARGPGGRPDPTAGLYVVQFVGPVRDAWLDRLAATGARIVQPMPMNAQVVAAAPAVVDALVALAGEDPTVRWVGAWQPGWRLTPDLAALAAGARGGERAVPVTVQLVDPAQAGQGLREAMGDLLGLASAVDGVRRAGPYTNLDIWLDPALLRLVARQPAVFAIERRGERTRLDERQGQISAGNVSGTQASSPGYLAWLAGGGFGSGQFGSFSVNVVDDATSLTGHPDLPSSRIDFQLNPTSQGGSQGGHGFLNAHIVAGFNDGTGSDDEDGLGYNYGLGIAPWAHVGATAIFGPGGLNPSSFESDAYQQGARISTNSWSFQTGGGAPIPDYDSWSQQYDGIVRDARSGQSGNQEYMVLFAAGNDGPGSNTVSTPGTAKNIVTVGASENWRPTGTDGCGVTNSGADDLRDIISFSSQGPVDSTGGDGRWKPEVVAQGTHVQAGVPQSNYDGSSVCNQYWPSGQTLYGWSSGTSHSTPAVAGGAALVRQWFLSEGMAAPSPAMNKAVLVNSAEYMTSAFANDTLPSNAQGMGRMHLGRAFDGTDRILVDQSVVLSGTGDDHVVTGNVSDTGEPFRVTLVWTDAPGATTGAPWVNDLDLTVSAGGTTYRGNVFSGATSVGGGSSDIRNNTESVFLPAGTSGAFTVTVDAATIAGDGVPGNGDGTDQDFALVVYNGATGPAPPTASFIGSPTTGVVPLTVDFTDQSTGSVTSWSWDFGDGGTSTAQDPSHTYNAVGTYTVSLTVSGSLGSDTETKTAYIDVTDVPPPGPQDGSFESQTAGSAPDVPWSITSGAGHVVSPSGVSSDAGMPSDGTQWCELAADSTNDATPPSNPGGVTTPPSGGAGISQSFSYGAGQTELSFDAVFLRNEDAGSQYNDWMSVDVSDSSTTVNLFYKDTFSSFSGTSSKYGYPTTPIETVTVDLATLFPSSTTSTTFTLTAQVGNGTDNIQPSKGYIDNVFMSGSTPAPVASFTGTPTSGVVPLDVDFTDTSSGGPITSWSWTFGDGGTSTAQDPSHTYTSAGTYTVSLTVTGPGGSDTATQVDSITVSEPAPVASFTGTPTSGVVPLDVDFTDTSSGGPITSWSWTFGDGGTSTAQNPSHTYTSAGTYTVSLTVTGPGGSDTATQVDSITVSEPAPVASFTGTPTSGVVPLDVDFTDTSSGGPITSWSWTFGDGGTSTAQDPSHTYTSAGTYTVSLTVTGPGGSDTATQVDSITVSEPAPVASFTGTPTSGVVPLDVDFTDTSSGGPITSWSWTFGDGGTSTAQDPSHTYTSAGTYTVSLTVTGPGGSDTATQVDSITVSEPAPVASFTGTPTSGVVPLDVDFTDTSSGGPITNWSWTFGDGGTSTAQDPSHTYTSAGTYTVSLTVTGPGGSDTATQVDSITVSEPAPVASFTGTPTSGVVPLDVDFTDTSSGGPITSWSWTFGDGGTSTAQDPSHTYTSAGTYTVSLTVTGPGGSDTATQVDSITVSEPAPVASFTGTPTSGVVPLDVDFTDTSSGGPITSWSWTFGDGGTSTAQDPSHTYTSAGTYTVSLTVTGPGGSDTATQVDSITVSEPAPVASFTGTPTSGVVPLDVDFTDTSSGGPITSWSWTFGDGGTSTAQDPSHTYTSAGTYTVSLTVTGPGGSDTATQVDSITVSEPAPVASFTGTPTSGVVPLDVDFTDTSSGGPITSWSWTFGDGGTSTAQDPSHTYTSAGTYTVSLTVTGPGGSDTATQVDSITVSEPAPVASFTGTPTSGVVPLDVDFTDTSSGGPITSWSWTFGDGGTSTAQDPSHTYTSAGTYTVSLTVTGPGGSDTATQVDSITVYDNGFVDLGSALAGTNGDPLLTGLGALAGDDPVNLTLTNALENTTAFLVVGLSTIDAPFKGGTLVPAPDIVTGFPTGPAGEIVIDDTWPAGLPSGFQSWYQYWIADAAGPAGFAASNALEATTP